ncbi:MAG: hypothetical protein K2L51_01345 [Clostridiales bacterium]|nr:hypothetical protein [Clostridiales bacterium]
MFDLNEQGTSLLNYKLVNGAELKCILNITGKATPEISFDFDTENCIEYTEGERYVYKADGKVHMPRKVTMTYENRTFAVLERPIDEWGEFLEADYFGDKKTYAFARTKLIGDKWYIDGSGDYASSLPRQSGTYRMVIRVSNLSYSEKDRDLFYDMVEYPVTIVIVDE